MALAMELSYDESKISNRFGDEYYIPVIFKIMDGATEKFSVTVQVEHNIKNDIDDSLNHPQVKKTLEDEIEKFNNTKNIVAQNSQITTSLATLKESLSLEAAIK